MPDRHGIETTFARREYLRTTVQVIAIYVLLFAVPIPNFGLLGTGFSQSPAATGLTLMVRQDELGVVLGIFNMIRFLSEALGSTVFGIVIGIARASNVNSVQGFHVSFYLVIAVAALALLLSAAMPRPPSPVTAAAD